MRQRRIGLREAALVIVAALGLGIGAGVLIHSQQAGHAASARDNPPGLHGQATWEPGERPAPDFQLADQSGRPVVAGFVARQPRDARLPQLAVPPGVRPGGALPRQRARAAARGSPAGAGRRERRSAARHARIDPRRGRALGLRSCGRLALAARLEGVSWPGCGSRMGWRSGATRCFRDRKEPRVPDRQKRLRARRSPLSLPADVAGRRSAHPGSGGMTAERSPRA